MPSYVMDFLCNVLGPFIYPEWSHHIFYHSTTLAYQLLLRPHTVVSVNSLVYRGFEGFRALVRTHGGVGEKIKPDSRATWTGLSQRMREPKLASFAS